jgi:hypothetical protein
MAVLVLFLQFQVLPCNMLAVVVEEVKKPLTVYQVLVQGAGVMEHTEQVLVLKEYLQLAV